MWSWRRRLLAALLPMSVGLVGTATAAEAPAAGPAAVAPARLAPELFFGPAELSEPALSPSGRWLALVVQRASSRRGLAVYDLHGQEPARELARFSDIDVGDVHWVGDDHLVFDVVDTERGSEDQRLGAGLFSVRRDGNALRQHILLKWWSNPGQGTLASRRLDATHSLEHVPRRQVPGAPAVLVRGARDPRHPWGDWVLKRLDLETGRVESLNVAEPSDATRLWFDAEGQPVLARSFVNGRSTLIERVTDDRGQLTRDWKPRLSADGLEQPWLPHSIDGLGRIYVTQPSGPNGEAVLKRLDRASFEPRGAALVNVPGFDFVGQLVEYPAPAGPAGDDPLLGIHVLADGWTTVWFDPAMAAVQKAVDARLPGRSNRLLCRRCRGDERTVVVLSSADRHPGELWLWRGPADAPATWRRLGVARPGIDPRQMAESGLVRFAARDGLEIPLWVTLPAQTAAQGPRGPAPAVVLVHGGPWVRGTQWGWSAMPQFLASRGYVVLEPEFRGSEGYGRRLHRAGYRQWGQAMQDDLVDAVRWAAGAGLVDAQRVCIAGASYGGYATLMGLVRHPEVFRCGAAWVPLVDLRWLLREGPPDGNGAEGRATLLPRMVADWQTEGDLLTRISPLDQIDRLRAPLLLAWGEDDERTPPAQAKALQRALAAAGRPPEAVGYAGEGHGWMKTETHLDFARRLEAFLGRHLGPADPAASTGAPAPLNPR